MKKKAGSLNLNQVRSGGGMEEVDDAQAERVERAEQAERVEQADQVDQVEQRKKSYLAPRPRSPRKNHKRALSASSHRPDKNKSAVDAEHMFQKPHIEHTKTKKRRNWTDENSHYVKRVGQRAGGFKWMHAQAAGYYNKCYNWWGISCIIVSAIAAAGDIPYVATCQADINWIKIMAIILGFLVTIALGIYQFKNYGGKTVEHRNSEANYDAFYEQIKQELQKNSKDRQDATDYVVWIAQGMTNLKNSSPIIPQHIVEKYREMIAGRAIADPDGLDEIIIKEDSPDRKTTSRQQLIETGTDANNNQPPLIGIIVERPNSAPPKSEVFRREQSEMEKFQIERWNEQEK